MRGARYRDTVVAKGTDLHKALEAGDMKLAEHIYTQCEREFRKHYPNFQADYEQTLQRPEAARLPLVQQHGSTHSRGD